MVINETKAFAKRVAQLLTDDEYERFCLELTDNPELGDVIRGGGGLRKVRCAMKGRGKRSGARVIYYWAVAHDQILMLFIFAKNEQSDLTDEQVRRLRKVVEERYP